MDSNYSRIREHALKIAARHPQADFYRTYQDQIDLSARIFNSDSIVCKLCDFVATTIDNDFGHGLDHCKKVSLDAGALMAVEGVTQNYPEQMLNDHIRLVQCAGLLHDIKRKQENHARKGAQYAETILSSYILSKEDIGDICAAISNHEAFGEVIQNQEKTGKLLSDCLYDSDKFRWGPDNFTHTVWDMVSFSHIPLKKFFDLYPSGVAFLNKIKKTFRTPTGREYGPQIIDIGISIGDELYAYIQKEFSSHL